MTETKNTSKTRADQGAGGETENPLVATQEPAIAATTWKYVGPKKASSVRFADDPRLYTADALSNDLVDRLIAEAPHTQAWYEKA